MTREPIKLLLVEDEQAHVELIERALARSDLSTALTHVSSGAEALSTLQEESFDLIFLDYSLPGQDGLDLLPRFIEAGCAVIMVTGKGSEVVAVEAMKRGAIDYVVKSPETFDLLPTIIRRSVEVRETQRRLAEAEAKYQNLIESSTDAIIATDRDGHIVVFNPVAEVLSGYRREEVIGKIASEVLPHFIEQEGEELFQAALRGEVVSVSNIPYQTLKGKSGYLNEKVLPVRDQEGKIVGAMAVVEDVTKLLRLEEQLVSLQEELEQRKLVEIAKGILMREMDLSEDESYRLIQKRSRDENRKMGEVAKQVIDFYGMIEGRKK